MATERSEVKEEAEEPKMKVYTMYYLQSVYTYVRLSVLHFKHPLEQVYTCMPPNNILVVCYLCIQWANSSVPCREVVPISEVK